MVNELRTKMKLGNRTEKREAVNFETLVSCLVFHIRVTLGYEK